MNDKASERHTGQPSSPKPGEEQLRQLQGSGEIVVQSEALPARAPKGKQIHARRPIPLIPESGKQETPEDRTADGD